MKVEHKNENTQTNRKSHWDEINLYQQRRSLGKGLMNLATFSSNANQLRYILEESPNMEEKYFYIITSAIVISILLQVAVAIGLIWTDSHNTIKDAPMESNAQTHGNIILGTILLITIINVFISSFGTPSFAMKHIRKNYQTSQENR
ncbi:ninjurin-1 isoform X3 [Nilaparvata lugens]|uniref:ninjurin-1 isoform X3 n=1 Tax=Nilaparvata lugens TaxID=108931 RepID=UPI00193E3FB3|nr:ninjurin-1 isoform X3 [Nilaparvata lugens]